MKIPRKITRPVSYKGRKTTEYEFYKKQGNFYLYKSKKGYIIARTAFELGLTDNTKIDEFLNNEDKTHNYEVFDIETKSIKNYTSMKEISKTLNHSEIILTKKMIKREKIDNRYIITMIK